MTLSDNAIATEADLEDAVVDMLDACDDTGSARSFKDRRIVTNDRGLVLRMANGAEYQITIVQSKEPRS